MEEIHNQNASNMSLVEKTQEEQELSYTDKIVGVFAEPQNIFTKIARFPAKTIDWVIPVMILITVLILGQFVLMTNAEIKQQQKQKGMQQITKTIDEAVKKGQITREQADEQMTKIENSMDSSGLIQTIGLIVVTPIKVLIAFFIISGFYLMVCKYGLKGEVSYKEVMVAYGLAFYIKIIHEIVTIIFSLALSKLFIGLSIADFMEIEKTTFAGLILSNLDIFSIWFYIVFGIALAKLNKSDDTKKYIFASISVWIAVEVIFFFTAKVIPFF